jgi:dolichol-phosphate mannosyltransferase
MKICVIIPCYKVKDKIINVVQSIPKYVTHVFVIDDCCTEQSGQYLLNHI